MHTFQCITMQCGTHAYALQYTRVHIYVLMYTRIHAYVLMYARVHAYVLMYTRVHAYVLMYTRVHAYVLPLKHYTQRSTQYSCSAFHAPVTGIPQRSRSSERHIRHAA